MPIAVLGLILAGCTGEPEAEFDPATTTVEYTFTDASVAPEVQRSFELTAADGAATVVVTRPDGDLIEEQVLSDDAIASLVTAYNAGELEDVFEADPSAPCTGASSQRLVLDGGENRAEISFTYCGDTNAEARTQLASAVAPLLDPFDIDTLTEGRYAG
ncbi:hypothetical protein [Pseudactinotalea sp.]|uniref:hypothetical protein n=1 Tax=Pseudactinotalea sp. TaxID=1926260 RepID=UPI003B3AE893